MFRARREAIQNRIIIVFEIGYRSHLKNWIFAQDQGGADVQPAGILKYSEELKRGPNTEIGQKNIFQMASKCCC